MSSGWQTVALDSIVTGRPEGLLPCFQRAALGGDIDAQVKFTRRGFVSLGDFEFPVSRYFTGLKRRDREACGTIHTVGRAFSRRKLRACEGDTFLHLITRNPSLPRRQIIVDKLVQLGIDGSLVNRLGRTAYVRCRYYCYYSTCGCC